MQVQDPYGIEQGPDYPTQLFAEIAVHGRCGMHMALSNALMKISAMRFAFG